MSRLKRRIIASISIVLAIAVLCTTFYCTKLAATAEGTLPGISDILNDKLENTEDPFTIIEIVANKDDARMGYLIGGEEPIYEGKALYEFPTKNEREELMSSFADRIALVPDVAGLVGNAFSLSQATYEEVKSGVDGSKQVFERGVFTESKENGTYYYKVPQGYVSDVSSNDELEYYPDKYSLYWDIDYDFLKLFDGNVSLTFKPRQSKSFSYNGETRNQYYSYSLINKIYLSDDNFAWDEMVGARVFFVSTDENDFEQYNLLGILGRNANGDIRIMSVDGTEVNPESLSLERYVFADFENAGVESGDYVFSDVFDVSENEANYRLYEHYEADKNGNYLKEKESISLDKEDDDEYYSFEGPYIYEPQYVVNNDSESDIKKINDSIYYTSSFNYVNGIKNNEWFKAFVMDIPQTDFDKYYFDVKTMTMDEFNKLSEVNADLVYFRSGIYTQDIDETTASKIISAVKENHLPVIMETGFDNDNQPNIHKLSLLLEQTDLNSLDWSTGVSSLKANTESHVSKSVFIVNGNLVNSSFVSEINPKVSSKDDKNFGEVYETLVFENNYRSKFGFSSLFDFSKDAISNATVVKYIINYAGRRITAKSAGEFKVLDLEPCYSFSPVYDEDKPEYEYDTEWWGGKSIRKDWQGYPVYVDNSGLNSLYRVHDYEKSTDLVVEKINHDILTEEKVSAWTKVTSSNSIVHTYTREFIGKVEDLNETYDLIYIGLDTTTMNTKISYSNGERIKTTNTIYHDNTLNGLVYSHMGDKVVGTDKVLYWKREDTDSPKYNYDNINNNYRMSGNDLTYEKFMDLKEYIDAGYALVFADDFFTENNGQQVVNKSKIDENSYMYRLADYALSNGQLRWNVFRESEINDDKDFEMAFNLQKLKVEFIEKPLDYTVNQKYLSENKLFFKVKLTNNAAIEAGAYKAKLFIDTNADGRYSDLEDNSVGLVILDERGAQVTELRAGKTYTIEKQLPTDYIGMIPWKLQFCQIGNENVRTAKTGYSAIEKKASERQKINVLQILTDSSGGSPSTNLDLSSSTLFGDLKDDVKDFNIKLTTNKAATIVKDKGTSVETCLAYFNQYDMLILGFADCFNFAGSDSTKTDNATKALAEYINNGKCVLFTHDTTSLFNFDHTIKVQNGRNQEYKYKDYWSGVTQDQYVWGYFFNKNVRTVVGMDRYNILGGSELYDYYKESNNPKGSVIDITKFDTTAENAETQKSKNTQGYTDSELTRYRNSNYLSTSRPTGKVFDHYNSNGQYNSGSYSVSQVNDGQITHYPFEIEKNMTIANTHYQYYQLNMDTYSKDDIYGDDIVVWYCISDVGGNEQDDMYQMNPNDVRNNYYIYNKGNVTYSGVGHSQINNEQEMKLFINTMVAAYQASSNSPDIKTYETKDGENSVNTIYLPYDYSESDYLDDNVSFYFSVNDSSTLGRSSVINEMMLTAHYYDNSGNLQDVSIALSSGDYEIYLNDDEVGLTLKENYVDNDKKTHTQAYTGLELNKRYKLVIKKDIYQKLDDKDNSLLKSKIADASVLAPYFSIEVHAMIENSQGGKSNWSNVSVEFRRTELFDLR